MPKITKFLTDLTEIKKVNISDLQAFLAQDHTSFSVLNVSANQGRLPGIIYYCWCFECFTFLAEALRQGIIKNRHDARFWGLNEKKALCGDCLKNSINQHWWIRNRKRKFNFK